MQKSIVILLSTSMLLISKDIFLRKENVSTEIITEKLRIYPIVNSNQNLISFEKEIINIGFYLKKKIIKSPLLNQTIDFSVGQLNLKKAEECLDNSSKINYYLGSIFEILSGNLLFGCKKIN